MDGQKKILSAKILCIGAGGLGSPAALYLAAAGVGCLGIVDSDVVELSNLQRQVLHGTGDVGRTKVESAAERLRLLNPGCGVVTFQTRITSKNAMEIIEGFDLVIDGSDNFPTRFLVNDACVLLRKPYVYAAVFQFEGQASVLAPHLNAPCYRCLYPVPPPPHAAPSCAEAGVLGVVPGVLGLIQATEALKLITGAGKPLLGKLLRCNLLEQSWQTISVKRDTNCPVCGVRPSIVSLTDVDYTCQSLMNNTTNHPDEVTVQDMKRALENPGLGITVIDVRDPDEHQVAHVEGVNLIPLGVLPQRASELDPEKKYYLHCKAGGRSMRAVEMLRAAGFENVKSVKGGIQAWSREIDPSVPMT